MRDGSNLQWQQDLHWNQARANRLSGCASLYDVHGEESDALLQHSTSSRWLLGTSNHRPRNNFWAERKTWWPLSCWEVCLGSTTAGKGSRRLFFLMQQLFSCIFSTFLLPWLFREPSPLPLSVPEWLRYSRGEKISLSDSLVVSFWCSLPFKWTGVF